MAFHVVASLFHTLSDSHTFETAMSYLTCRVIYSRLLGGLLAGCLLEVKPKHLPEELALGILQTEFLCGVGDRLTLADHLKLFVIDSAKPLALYPLWLLYVSLKTH